MRGSSAEPAPQRVRIGRAAAGGGAESPGTACHAPSLQLYLYPTGDVRACCRSFHSLGNVSSSSLSEIWTGHRRALLVENLREHDYSLGCGSCAAEVAIEGREGSFPATFDYWHGEFGVGDAPEWPARIEFNLSNICNLQCVQCSGESSSSIRIHREKRPPLQPVYGDAFFEDLRRFLPHLRRASFAGGEPFLGPENHRVWDLLAEDAPELPCTIITNATQWNDRVEHVLDSLVVHPIVSIDGATAPTYESIRVGADFTSVLRNIDRLCRYARERRTTMSLNFCLMRSNVHEFADMLLLAEERDLALNVCVVRSPVEHSLARLGPAELSVVADELARRDAEMERELTLNLATWRIESRRIRAWAEGGDTEPSRWSEQSPTVLMFPRQGDGPTDPDAELPALAASAADGVVHRLTIGPDDLARGCTRELATRFGLEPDSINGSPLSAILPAIRRYDIAESSPDRYEATFRVDSGTGRLVIVPERDAHGRADAAVALVAFDPA